MNLLYSPCPRKPKACAQGARGTQSLAKDPRQRARFARFTALKPPFEFFNGILFC